MTSTLDTRPVVEIDFADTEEVCSIVIRDPALAAEAARTLDYLAGQADGAREEWHCVMQYLGRHKCHSVAELMHDLFNGRHREKVNAAAPIECCSTVKR